MNIIGMIKDVPDIYKGFTWCEETPRFDLFSWFFIRFWRLCEPKQHSDLH